MPAKLRYPAVFLLFVIVFGVGRAGEPLLTVPATLSYQGFLADAEGVAFSGQVEIAFSLYDSASGGHVLWTEVHPAVNVLGGLFQVELGLLSALEDPIFDGPLYLGLAIDGAPELLPRSALTSLPFARRAGALLACPVLQTNCFGVCADLQSDPSNCGSCGEACAEGDSCVGGECLSCTPQTFYRDADGDGFGDCGDSILACTAQAPYTALICGDCNDDNPNQFPGALEICDGVDNDCNGKIDDGDLCIDGLECTADICGMLGCENPPLTPGTVCSIGICDGLGNCLECLAANDCGIATECATPTCNAGACGFEFSPIGTPCGESGTCDGSGTCQ